MTATRKESFNSDELSSTVCQPGHKLGTFHFNLAGAINYLSRLSSHHMRSLRSLSSMVRYTNFIGCITTDARRADTDRMVDPIRRLLASIRFSRSFGSDRLAFNICATGSDPQSAENRQGG